MNEDLILSVRDLRVSFAADSGPVQVLRGLELDLPRGQTLALVGESGAGKSVTARVIMGLPAPGCLISGGSILFSGRRDAALPCPVDLLRLSPRTRRRRISGRCISMVFQDPALSLDPTMPIGRQISEGLPGRLSRRQARLESLRLLERVGLSPAEDFYRRFPHQLSGGQRQRAAIAAVLACGPELLLCDEPTTALDVTVQARILALLRRLQEENGLSILYITHDLSAVAGLADRVAVLHEGRIAESGPVEQIFRAPAHPYTRKLLGGACCPKEVAQP